MSKKDGGVRASVPLYIPPKWNGILIVGDYPSAPDVNKGIPFRGGYGLKLAEMLSGVGIKLKECATTYCFKEIPPGGDVKTQYLTKSKVKTGEAVAYCRKFITPEYREYIDEIHSEVRAVRPKFIITLGEAALFGILGESGIDDFRGSMEYYYLGDDEPIPVLPTHSPSRVLKQMQLRYLVSRDFQRIEQGIGGSWPEPNWKIVINPSYDECISHLGWFLDKLEMGETLELGVDIETRRRFYIGTLGFAWSGSEAIVIPFITPDWEPYWEDAREEFEIVKLCKAVLEHPNVRIAGQNYHYDAQYLARHWGVASHIWCDTMIAHHCCFTADIPKGLHVISSIYNDYHQYWKDESHSEDDDKWEPTWDNWDNYLTYNGKDCCTTLEAARVLMDNAVPSMDMEKGWKFQYVMWQNLLKCMLRGNLYDWDERHQQRRELETRMKNMEAFMEAIVPECIFPRNPKTPFYKSPTQLKDLFYNVLNVPPATKKNNKREYVASTDDSALHVIQQREPILKPLCEAISAYRSMRVFYDNFLTGTPDYDDYLRSMYHLAGTSTTRLASRGDVFDFGLNLQNLPKGDG